MNRDNPWTRLKSRVVYQNAWITVREDNVLRPDGLPGIYGVVETRIATGVVAVTPDRHVYLVGQYRYPVETYSWEIVEGGTEDGESPLEAAQRELREEAGLTAGRWRQLGEEVHLSNCHSSEAGLFFLAEDLSSTTAAPDCTEVLEVRALPLPECVAMVERGEIKDAMSIIAILRAERWFRNEP